MSLVKGREVPATHAGTGLGGATGVRWKVFTGTSQEGQGGFPAQLLAVQSQCQGPGEEPLPQGRARPDEVMGWSGTEIPQGRQNWELNIKSGHFPRPARFSDKLTKREELLQNGLLLESEFKERTIVQGEAKVL